MPPDGPYSYSKKGGCDWSRPCEPAWESPSYRQTVLYCTYIPRARAEVCGRRASLSFCLLAAAAGARRGARMGFSDVDSDSSLSCEKRRSHKDHKSRDKDKKSHKKKHDKDKDKSHKRKHHHHHRHHHSSDKDDELDDYSDKKRKKHHHHHRHDRKRGDDGDASNRRGAVDLESQSAAAWEAFAAVVVANPGSRGELKELLRLLDEGQMVVVDSINDPATRSRLESALDALGLPTQHLPDGSLARAKPDGASVSLSSHFSSLFDGIGTDSPGASPAGRRGAGTGAPQWEETATEAAAAQPPRRVYGVAMPPPPSTATASDAVGNQNEEMETAAAIGPSVPAGIGSGAGAGGGGDDDDDEVVGPALPANLGPEASGGGGSADHLGGGGGKRWWEREQEAPKEAPPLDPALVGATSAPPLVHEEWMTDLPTDRVGFNPTEARQFTRNGVQSKGDTSIWTDTGADKARKASEQWVGGGASGASSGGAGAGAPMTLADAVALAKANAAAGRRPRAHALGGGGGADGAEKPKSLVELADELKAEASKDGKKKEDWEGHHPWRPWDREKDLDIRASKPKAKESILNDQIMGTLSDRFGGSGRRETTFM